MQKGNVRALLPFVVFLFLYIGTGIAFEIIFDGEKSFNDVPIVVIALIALMVACFQNKELSLQKKFEIMGKGIGDKDIVTMILIFLAAGIFTGVIGQEGARSMAYFLLSLFPQKLAIPTLFVISSLVSLAMGTSVGTVAILSPIAISISETLGFPVAACIAAVLSGAMFGDNLSFISDTTIASCNGQGCNMKDKFRTNAKIALPAAAITLIILSVYSVNNYQGFEMTRDYNLIHIVPYVFVLIGGIIGINVFVNLLLGTISGVIIIISTGADSIADIFNYMKIGTGEMFETTIITLLIVAISALIREYGGFTSVINLMKRIFKGKKGTQLGIGALVGFMDIATANNTVAIVVTNPIAKEISKEYDISPQRTATLIDIFSCIFQCFLPYGSQMLLALACASAMEKSLSAVEVMPLMVYPMTLLVAVIVFILIPERKKKK